MILCCRNKSDMPRAIVLVALLLLSTVAAAQTSGPKKAPAKLQRAVTPSGPGISLSPRFSPGQTFRYTMQFETTTATSRSGLATDPQGPSNLVITWNATILLEVLPAEASEPGSLRLRTTY